MQIAKSFIVCLLVLSGTMCSMAQDDPPTARASKVIRANELGFNVAPIGIFVMHGLPVQPRFNLTYKRLVETKFRTLAFRGGLSHISDYSPDKEAQEFENSVLLSFNDTVQVRMVSTIDRSTFGAFGGIEWRLTRKNNRLIMGFDVFYRNISIKGKVSENHYVEDLFCPECQPSLDIENERESNNVTMSEIGVSPFIGGLFRISRNFWLSGEIGFETRTPFGKDVITNYGALGTNEPRVFQEVVKAKGTHVTFPGIIKDLSIYWRF